MDRRTFYEQNKNHRIRSSRRFYHRLLQNCFGCLVSPQSRVLEVGCATGDLLASVKPSRGVGVDFSPSIIAQAKAWHPDLEFCTAEATEYQSDEKFDYILLSDLVNDLPDVQKLFERVQRNSFQHTRLVVNFYNTLWRPILATAEKLGLKSPTLPQNWLSLSDIKNLLHLAGWEIIKVDTRILWPIRTPLWDTLLNRWLAPLLKGNASDPASFLGYLTLTGTLANIYKLVWFWVTRHDIARLILSASDARGRVSFVTRGLSVLVPAVSIALPIGLWFTIIISSVSVLSEQISTAAGLTQVLFFVVPILAAGAYAVVWSLMEEAGELSAGGAASRAALSALAGAAIAAGGLLILQNTWDFALAMQAPQAVAGVHAVVAAAVVLLAGWVVLQYLKAFFEAHAPRRAVNRPGEEDDSDAAPLTRMATALPLIRNVALATVAAIAGLVALAKLGLDTAPLLAGAGIVGLGISFGSQALVRDIMSGIFFMGDDAFQFVLAENLENALGHGDGAFRGAPAGGKSVGRIVGNNVDLRHGNIGLLGQFRRFEIRSCDVRPVRDEID